jgi:DNA repair ATPase RecN
MSIFNKTEKKLRQELFKRNLTDCKDTVKELAELHEDLKESYATIDTVTENFTVFAESISAKLTPSEAEQLRIFSSKLKKVDKCARDAVRDIRDVLRTHKKRLKELQNEK